MALQILVTGDIHVGRTSTRLPAGFPVDDARAVNGWHSTVDLAIQQKCDLLLLTGDIADQDNAYWEAIGRLEAGIVRLKKHDIYTVAVAGNHDHDILPRLADELEGSGAFRLLGRDGTWERYTHEIRGQAVVHIDGWSFPNRYFGDDPVATYALGDGGGVPVIGMVHGDLDVPDSRYAPLSLARLRAQRVDGWVLGHIHKPQLAAADKPYVLYPGSPQALSFGELGAHGPWRFDVDHGVVSTPEQVPASCCRYEELPIDTTGTEDGAALQRLIFNALGALESKCREDSGESLQALSVRLRLTGRCSLSEQIAEEKQQLSEYSGSGTGLTIHVDDVRNETMPAADLNELQRGSSPLAVAARLLVAFDLDTHSDEIDTLVAAAQVEIDTVAAGRNYMALSRDESGNAEAARAMVRSQLAFIVDQLLRQQEEMA